MRRQELTLVSFVLFTTACDEIEPYLPDVKFQGFEVEDIDFEQINVDFVFDVVNPNPVDITLSSFEYNLGFENVHLLGGNDSDGFELEAVGASELRLPVELAWQDAWATVEATRGQDDIGFGLNGNFGFNTPIGEAVIPYSDDGQFPAVRTPAFAFQALRVKSLDWVTQTAKIEVDIALDNDHGSTLFFENFDYDLSLGGDHVASGLIADFATVNGATEKTVTMPVNLDLVNAGTAVWNALAGQGNLAIGLDATTEVDSPFGLLPLHVDETGDVTVE